MNEMIPFSFEGAPVRSVIIDGELHLMGKDVAERLGYADPTNAMKQHCKGVVKRHPLQTPGGIQEVRFLARADVMRLIVGSKLPAAARFERWVFEEVMPAVVQTGGYMVAAPEETVEQLTLRTMALLSATVERQKARMAALAPQAQAFERIAMSDGSLCITDAAKTLQVRPKDLTFCLREKGWVYSRGGSGPLIGCQARIAAGLLEHKTTTLADGTKKTVPQVRVTPKGLAALALLVADPKTPDPERQENADA